MLALSDGLWNGGDEPQTQRTEKEAECLSPFLIQKRRSCGDPDTCLSPQRIQGVTTLKPSTADHQCPVHWDDQGSDCALALFVKRNTSGPGLKTLALLSPSTTKTGPSIIHTGATVSL